MSDKEQNNDDILNDLYEESEENQDLETEIKTEEESKEETPTAEEPETKEGDKEQKTDEPPTSKDDKKSDDSGNEKSQIEAFKAMGINERKKRQSAEAEIAELKSKLASLMPDQNKNQETKQEPRPDVNDDPEGALKYTEASILTELYRKLYVSSEKSARKVYDDFDDKKIKFMELAKSNPQLNQQALTSDDPGEFVYQTAKNALESEKYSDPNYIKNLEQEIEKRILAELVSSQRSNQSDVTLPPDFTKAASTKEDQVKVETVDYDNIISPLDKI